METIINNRWILPALAFVAAVVTNTILPGSGALLLLPLLLIFWFIQRFSRREMGFVIGQPRHYGLGLLHPLLVISLMALVALMAGATNMENTDWSKVALDFAVMALLTILVTIVTEDGFFRGWLWAALQRAGLNEQGVALWTGVAFGVWHLPYAILDAGYDPFTELPLFIINASIIGFAWGLLRLISGSVIVPSVVHGIWNGAVYVLFNRGAEIGALGIQETAIFGPEAGLLGLALNVAYTIGLWLWYRRAEARRDAASDLHRTQGVQRQDAV